jgi:uncharacterized protein (DUF1697 family)
MTAYVALLRAVNVGGTGKLPMSELVRLCETAGLDDVRTYIASGNALFTSRWNERRLKRLLEERLAAYAGRPVGVLIRTAAELTAVHADNPFRKHPANSTVAIFLDTAPARYALDEITGHQNERVALGTREIYVAYGGGMARSKLKIPAAKAGTARNLNTVANLARLASAP